MLSLKRKELWQESYQILNENVEKEMFGLVAPQKLGKRILEDPAKYEY